MKVTVVDYKTANVTFDADVGAKSHVILKENSKRLMKRGVK